MKSIVTLITLLTLSPVIQAADINAGKAKSVTCAGCHGPAGISANPEWPNLAGQQDVYLKKQIIAFRDGVRKNALMAPMVKPLSDEDAANIAAYYASLKP